MNEIKLLGCSRGLGRLMFALVALVFSISIWLIRALRFTLPGFIKMQFYSRKESVCSGGTGGCIQQTCDLPISGVWFLPSDRIRLDNWTENTGKSFDLCI